MRRRAGCRKAMILRGSLLSALCLTFVLLLPSPATATAFAKNPQFTVEDVTPYTTYTTTRLNVRTGPGIRWDWIVTLDEGAEVTVTGVASTGWLRIRTKEIPEGFTSARFYTAEKADAQSAASAETASVETSDAMKNAETADAAEETAAESAEEAGGSAAAGEEESTAVTEEPAKETETVAEETVEAPGGETATAGDVTADGYIREVIKEATCSSAGSVRYTSADGSDSYLETVPRLDHTPGEWVVGREATWTKAGVRYQNCAVCGQTLSSEEIPANPLPLILIVAGVCAAVVIVIVTLAARSRKKE